MQIDIEKNLLYGNICNREKYGGDRPFREGLLFFMITFATSLVQWDKDLHAVSENTSFNNAKTVQQNSKQCKSIQKYNEPGIKETHNTLCLIS